MTSPGSLIIKLCAVMDAVDHVEKNGRNREQNYEFARDVDVSAALRVELSKRHIFLLSSIVRVEPEIYVTKSGGRGAINTVYTLHKFIDGDSGETLEFTWASQGMDGQDKGVSKAATSSIKYALLKQFLIPTGEDPDAGGVPADDQPAAKKQAQRPPSPPQRPPAGAVAHQDATLKTASDVARKWFMATMKEQCGVTPDEAKALLGIKSFTEDMGDKSFGTILGFIKAEQLRRQREAAS